MSTNSLRDDILAYYTAALGHSGSVIALEREFFILSLGSSYVNNSWADCARQYYASWNGSATPGSLYDEAFKYYSTLSGLTPAASYSISDHMWYVFDVIGGPVRQPPVTDNLEMYYDAAYPFGPPADGRNSKNLCTYNQATVEIDTTGLSSALNCTIARSTLFASQGVASLEATSNGAGATNFGSTFGLNGIPVTPGKIYTFVCDLYAPVITVQAQLNVVWYDSSGANIGQSQSGSLAALSASWKQYVWTATAAPANAAYANLRAVWTAVGASEKVYLDKMGLWEGTSTDWVLPGKLNNINKLTANQASVETDTTGFTTLNASPTLARVTAPTPPHGVGALSITSTAATTNVAGTLSGTSGIPVVAGRVYTGVISIRSAAITSACLLRIYWWKADGSASSITAIVDGASVNVSVGAWQQIFTIATAPADAAYASIGVRWVSVGVGEVVYGDMFGFWEGYSQVWAPPYQSPSDGLPIETMRDISGKSRHLVQTTIARQPTYRGMTNRNLLSYNTASMETDVTPWGVGANCTLSKVASPTPPHGISALALTSVGAGNMTALTNFAQYVPVVEGQTYTAYAEFQATASGRSVNVSIQWRNGAGGLLSTTAGSSNTDTPGSWLVRTATGVAPAGALLASVLLQVVGTAGAAEIHNVDKAGFWVGSAVTWVPPTINVPSIQFDGVDDYLRVAGIPVFANTTVYSVARLDMYPAANNRWVSIFGGAGVHDHYAELANGNARVKGGAAGFPNVVTPKDAFVATRVVSSTYDGANISGFTDGIALNNPVAATGALGTSMDVGAAGGASNACVEVCAVLVFSTIHTTQQRQLIERWLGALYGATVA